MPSPRRPRPSAQKTVSAPEKTQTEPSAKAAAKAKPAPKKAAVKKALPENTAPVKSAPVKSSGAKPAPKKNTKPKPEPKAPELETPVSPPPADKPPHEQTGREKPEAAASASPFDTEMFRRLEDISVNITKAALTAQTALAQAAVKAQDLNQAGNAVDPMQVGPAMTNVMTSLASRPEKIVEAQADLLNGYMSLWSDVTRRTLSGETAADGTTQKKDKRFADPMWEQNIVFDMMRQSYLLSSNWINGLVSSVDDIDPLEKRRAEFFTKLVTDAFSPSNFLMSNPAALQTLMETNGESLVKGMQKFADDLARGNGKLKISQADYEHFEVGKNVATSEGKVIWRGPLFELIQYNPTTETVREIPILIFPPWINKFYILDLQPKNSLIKWLTDQGFTVFITSWINPDASLKDTTFEDYMFGGIYQAAHKVKEQTGANSVHAVGYCIGGTLLGVALAHMAAKGDTSISSATFFTAQHDFSEAGDLLLFTNETWLKELERQMDAAGGVLPGAAMADTFNALRANDLVWSFFVNNYLLGKDLTAFDLLCWNADQTRMPKALHMYYLRKFYNENALSQGLMKLAGVDIDLKNVTIPIFEQAGREDHIAPPVSVFKSSRLFGGPVKFVLAGSGHIAGVVNPPAAQKYMHWVNDEPAETFGEWLEKAVEHKGSWWPLWAKWLHERTGKLIPARDPSKGKLKPIEDAPGSYVRVKS
ncbi:class I poly(R)-hydroxyalkanoic acid synthase [Asticcacaulis tiandongensis]|uniref:class I poly(R)-hydroxyalkanoic acid synthase n=1 Tax=Asticcacaulis tiandongensis TaxID=2565365 RepID=UPI001129AAB8|nr:class I poly(R)-hydroxyalkanoic acid synthase [Asticcacaulis tiandongensis]